jgi:hypothetical protein
MQQQKYQNKEKNNVPPANAAFEQNALQGDCTFRSKVLNLLELRCHLDNTF